MILLHLNNFRKTSLTDQTVLKSNAFSKIRGGWNEENRSCETSTKVLCFYQFKLGANANKCQSNVNGRKCIQKTRYRPRPLVATLGDNVSHILCLKDFDTKVFFIIYAGSDYNIVKSNSFEIKNHFCDQYLIAANTSKIFTHGERTTTTKIKLSKNRFIKWKFVSAKVSHNIIGADFLEGNNLLVDLYRLILVDADTLEKFPLINQNFVKENSPLLFVAKCKFTLIMNQFPDLTRPGNKANAKKVPVEHRIKVEGYTCNARVRPISAEKLKWLEEIQKFLDEDIIEVSDSEYTSPIHLVPKAPGSDT